MSGGGTAVEASRWFVDRGRELSFQGWQAGDVLLETLRVVDGRALRAAEHAARMGAAAELCGPLDHAASALTELVSLSRRCSEQAPRPDSSLRWFLPLAPEPGAPRWAAQLSAYSPPLGSYERGVSLAAVTLPHPGDGLYGKSAQRRHWQIARQQARRRGADEALLLDRGRAMETDSGALVWRRDGRYYAVRRDAGVLPSVTLGALAPELALTYAEPPALAELYSADAVWLVSALRLMVPVSSLDGQQIAVDSATAALSRALLVSI